MKKFNEHFQALTGLHNASNNQMLKQSCNQLPDAITRSRIFCDHLSQCAMVVSVLQGLRNAREKQCTLTDEGASKASKGRMERGRASKAKATTGTQPNTQLGGGGGGCTPPTSPALVKQQTPLLQTQRTLSLANWPARHVRTKKGKPHGNALGGLKTEKNEEKEPDNFPSKACPHTK